MNDIPLMQEDDAADNLTCVVAYDTFPKPTKVMQQLVQAASCRGKQQQKQQKQVT